MHNPLKILVVLPLYGGSLPIGQYCTSALKNLGHKVEVFQAPEFHSAFLALQSLKVSPERNDFLQNAYANLISEAVYAKAQQFNPDLILAMAQAPLTKNVLKRFQKENIPTAMWFVEDYQIFTYWRAFAHLYSYFFVIQKEPFLSLLKEGGQSNAFYLPLAALSSFHKKKELSSLEKTKYGADVAFLGAGYPNRRVEFRKLTGFNFKIWGSDWEGEQVLAPNIQNEGKRIDPATSTLIYNATKININLHSSVKAQQNTVGDFVNPRTFELAAMEAFQLTDSRSLMAELFELEGDKREIVTFQSFDQVPSLINYYLAHKEEREKISQRAKEKILAKHTYEKRMEALLHTIFPEGKEKKEDYFNILPQDIKEQLQGILEKHNLNSNTTFDDLIYALKQESKPLDSLEISLLFLDEWRKQYG